MGLRVGLTGGLGSGKSTVAAMLAQWGAHVLSADEIGRALMQPGQAVYDAIAERFGPQVVRADGQLDRPALARMAFTEGRVDELNAIVHPATIACQGELADGIFARQPDAVVVVESALIFESKFWESRFGESKFGGGWRERFDRLILVTAPEPIKIERYITRAGGEDRASLEAEARRRLAQMIPDEKKMPLVDFVIHNTGTLDDLRGQVAGIWASLRTLEAGAEPAR